jgi:hypothetical protein
LPAYKPAPIRYKVALNASQWTGKQKVDLNHLTSYNAQFTPKNLSGTWKLKVSVNGPSRATAPAADLWVFLKTGAVKGYRLNLNASGDGVASVKFSSSAVARVTLTLTNASTRVRNCYSNSDYACGGTAVDDRQPFVYSATPVRR